MISITIHLDFYIIIVMFSVLGGTPERSKK